MKTIGKRIKQLRKNKGESMALLGKAIGTDSANISNWESDKRVPGGKFIVALSEYFNVSTDWILKGTTVQEMDHQAAFLVTHSSQLHSQIGNLPRENQHFIHAFVNFYRDYIIHTNPQEEILQQQFSFLPLLKQTMINENILSEENIATYLPIPITLAKEGDLLYSNSYELDQLSKKKKVELAVVKRQANAASGQTVLATYDKRLVLCKLIKHENKWILNDIHSNNCIGTVDEQEIHIHGVVTSFYNSASAYQSET